MIIYTVVGLLTNDSYIIIKSFTDEDQAKGLVARCSEADESRPRYQIGVRIVDELRAWSDSHPAGKEYHYDSYDVVEHELIGLIDITTSEDNTARFAVITDKDAEEVVEYTNSGVTPFWESLIKESFKGAE